MTLESERCGSMAQGSENTDSQPGRSVVRVRVSQEGKASRRFEPLTPPRNLEVSWNQSNFDHFRYIQTDLRVGLEPGRHSVPILVDETLFVDVGSGCGSTLKAKVGHLDEGTDPQAIITELEWSFDSPLVLYNIIPILARLHTLFRDRELAEWLTKLVLATQTPLASKGIRALEQFVNQAGGGFLSRLIPTPTQIATLVEKGLETLRTTSDQTAVVRLSLIRATPVFREGVWQLDFRFSGEVVYFGTVTAPFRDLKVPRLVIPSAHAALKKLVSGEPLASASVRLERLPARTLLMALSQLVSGIDGEMSFAGDTPDLDVQVCLAGGGTASTLITTQGETEGRVHVASQIGSEGMTAKLDGLELKMGGMGAVLDGEARLALAQEEEGSPEGKKRSVASVLVADLMGGGWSSERFVVETQFSVRPGAKLPPLGVQFHYEHPLLTGELLFNGRVEELQFEGNGAFLSGPAQGQQDERFSFPFSCQLVAGPGNQLSKGEAVFGSSLVDARLEGHVTATAPGQYQIELGGESQVRLHSSSPVHAYPEFGVDDSSVISTAEGRCSFQVRATSSREGRQPAIVDFSGSSLTAVAEKARIELDGRVLVIPEAAEVRLAVEDAVIATTGLGHSAVKANWDFHKHSPILHGRGRIIDLLVPELRSGEVTVHISPAGGMSITGPEWGLFDAHFFNALLHPAKETKRLVEMLEAEEVVEKATAVMEVFSPELSQWLERIRHLASRARLMLKEERITQPRDLIPAPKLARFIARLLSDQPGLEQRLLPIVLGVVAAKGLDVPAVKRIVYDLYPDHQWEFEVDRLLRWLDHVLRPSDPPAAWEPCKLPPLSEDPQYVRTFESLPSAARIYRTVDSAAPLPAGFSATVARVAAYLTLEQLEYIVERRRTDWAEDDLARIRYVMELKRRVRMIGRDYGGVTFAPQAMAISFFLANAIAASKPGMAGTAARNDDPKEFIPGTFFGPEDVALVLQAGLASAWSGRSVQVNQRRLLDLVFGLPAPFLHSVLVELGGNDHRVLTGALNVLLNMPQDLMKSRLDMVSELSQRLGLIFPRIEDYLAGGRWAKLSYYEALSTVAEQILSHAEPYRALKYYLQEVRHPVSVGRPTTRKVAELMERAQKAIAHADTVGSRCTFKTAEPTRRKAAKQAYEAAFQACSALLAADSLAFQLPWFKQFWGRNHEALVVLSVVRNVQQDTDRVRPWLEVRTNRAIETEEQRLLDQVVESLYFHEADRSRLLSDPLVRLLIDPPEEPLDFTVVSCMGVITEGAEGTELEGPYGRLLERYQVKTVRADTATARSLEHNAQRIIEAIRGVQTPYGLVGYSQGCANALLAEAKLLSGTPYQQGLLQGLVTRNLLFSAANGSSHGTCGDLKFARAMVEMDRFLSHYQAIMSRRAIDGFLRVFRTFLDSRSVVDGILGTRSVSRWGVLPLQRGGQFLANCPTSIVRGVVEPGNMPEALEFLANSLTYQNESPLHDTQVAVEDAVGHFTLTQNPQADVLALCDMGCMVQRAHHWSPLLKETSFVTTDRDIQRAIYDGPKDRLVFPWIQVNARFGIIRRKEG